MNRIPLFEEIGPAAHPLKLEENSDGKGNLYLKGLLIQGEIKNHNGRIYPLSEIKRAITSLKEKIAGRNGVLGELDHPEGLNINLDRVSHAITEVNLDGANGTGKLRILNNNNGHTIKSIVEAGVQIGVSSRGSGSVGHDGRVSDFEIITVDVVATPSAPDAHPIPVIESLRRSRYGREALTLIETVRDDRAAQKYIKQSIDDFLMSIRDELVWRKS